MSDPNWGLLVKSQVDNETIEEAIDRIVLAHAEDSESHLGVGESLQSHKASEIIDHVAGSIVADKINPFELLINESWPPVASMVSGSNCTTPFPRISVEALWGVPETMFGAFYIPFPDAISLWTYEFIFRVPVQYEQYGTGNFLQFGLWNPMQLDSTDPDEDGVYFSVEDGEILGRVKLGAFDESVALGVADEVSDVHIWEINYNPTDKLVKFKINDVVIDSIDVSTLPTFGNGAYIGARAYAPDEDNQINGASSKLFISLRTP